MPFHKLSGLSCRLSFPTLLFFLLVAPLVSLAQMKSISGNVTSDTGAPLSSISVTIQHTQRGTVTDENGRFTIQAANGETLVSSLVPIAMASVTKIGVVPIKVGPFIITV